MRTKRSTLRQCHTCPASVDFGEELHQDEANVAMLMHQELTQGCDRLRLEPGVAKGIVQQPLPQDTGVGAGIDDAAGLGGHGCLDFEPETPMYHALYVWCQRQIEKVAENNR